MSQLRLNSLMVMIPPTVSGLLMMLLRPWFGEIRHSSSAVSNLQYSLLGIFVVMTFVCVATAWFSYVANIRIQAANASRIADFMPIVSLLRFVVWQIPVVMSVTWLLFSNRGRFVALILFLALNAIQMLDFSMTAFWYAVYRWSIVLVTMGVFRFSGYRLLGHIPGVADPSKPISPWHNGLEQVL